MNELPLSPRYQLYVIVLLLCFGCQSDSASTASDTEVFELDEYNIIISQEGTLLGLPIMVKHEEATDHLFVYDIAQQQVFEMNSDGEVAVTYGGKGRGPGEVQMIGNFFITPENIYLMDAAQFVIHKYDRDGEVVSTFDYGKLLFTDERASDSESRQPPPPPAPAITDLNNEPFVTLDGDVLVPSLRKGRSLFERYTWEGEHRADIGAIPEQYDPSIDDESIRRALENMQVPAKDLHRAFPVNDPANPDELFLVYSSIPKVAKYDRSGSKLWEREIPATGELDSLALDIYSVTETHPDFLLPVKKYVSGAAGPGGELYLSTFTHTVTPSTRSLWIHRFTLLGELTGRYKIISEGTLHYYPGFDFIRGRFLTSPLQEPEIRAYNVQSD